MSFDYFISDLHFGHKNILKFTDPTNPVPYRSGDTYLENMHNIVQKINGVVTKRDNLYILGDVAFSDEGFEALSELNGTKIMIRGNHDDHFPTQKWLTVFKSVESMVKYRGRYWLTHCPIHPAELRGKKNIHGHVHYQSIRDANGQLDTRYINVCCEALGEIPIRFSEIDDGTYYKIRKC